MNDTRPVDFLSLSDELSEEERNFQYQIRQLVDTHVRPHVAQWFAQGHFPKELATTLGEAGMLGTTLQGYGCPGRTAVEYGLGALELEAGDSGIRTFVSVQGSLAMNAIYRFGSELHKEVLLPRMAQGETIGCFALTEPEAGSDPASMLTTASPTGDGWVINGSKRWIGLASIADIAVVWAKTPDGVRGFIVPTSSPGFTASAIEGKLSMRASVQCDISLDNVRVPKAALLPGTTGLRSPMLCLNDARYGIAWGAVGAARDSLEAALAYAVERKQFGQPLAAFQLTQQKLADMLVAVERSAILALYLGRRKDRGVLKPEQISLAKLANVRDALDVCRSARTIIGGNGVTLDFSPMRHANNLESVKTYEGTDEMHSLILGEALTGIAAFR